MKLKTNSSTMPSQKDGVDTSTSSTPPAMRRAQGRPAVSTAVATAKTTATSRAAAVSFSVGQSCDRISGPTSVCSM